MRKDRNKTNNIKNKISKNKYTILFLFILIFGFITMYSVDSQYNKKMEEVAIMESNIDTNQEKIKNHKTYKEIHSLSNKTNILNKHMGFSDIILNWSDVLGDLSIASPSYIDVGDTFENDGLYFSLDVSIPDEQKFGEAVKQLRDNPWFSSVTYSDISYGEIEFNDKDKSPAYKTTLEFTINEEKLIEKYIEKKEINQILFEE